MKRIILDTAALLYGAKLGMIKNYHETYECLIPAQVFDDIQKGIISQHIEHSRINHSLGYFDKVNVPEREITSLRKIANIPDQDLSLVALAKMKKCILICDDIKISHLADFMNIENYPTTELIKKLFKAGKINKEDTIIGLRLLDRYGYSKELVEESLKEVKT
jgi:predicted nucleic acid-binding protein